MNSTRILVFASLSLSIGCVSTGKGDDSGVGADGTDGTGAGALDCDDTTGLCVLDTAINSDVTLTADYQYVLPGGVFVGDGSNSVTLTIEAGVTVYGQPQSFLAIQQGSRIEAVGTEDAPIVFTSPNAVGERNRADWGGLILNGRAPINACSDGSSAVEGCTAEGEGSTGTYGGDEPSDSSGTLRYVRVEFGGYEVTPENEVNGIAFQGVGSGTEVSYIQVHMNKDDGVEFYGGTVSADHVVITGAGDDSLDWTEGWTGSATHVLIQQAGDAGDRGIEADNNGDQNLALPFSSPTLSKVTILASAVEDADGILLREGTKGILRDVLVTGAEDNCLDIDHDQTFANAEDGSLSVSYTHLSCDTYFKVETDDAGTPEEDFGLQAWFEGQDGNSTGVSTGLESGWMPAEGGILDGTGSDGGAIGAFEPGDDWASAWITTDEN